MNYVLFEESGDFKAGGVLADNETSLQVEMPSGKRGKIKASQILLRFSAPAPARLLPEAKPLADGIDAAFLWEMADGDEFSFLDLAREYYGGEPSAPETVSLLLALHGAPIYFHRKGRGRFRKAPADILRAALAAVEKKREQTRRLEEWVHELKAGRLPDALRSCAASMLGSPDRNRPEVKAFEAAAAERGCEIEALLLEVGAFASPYAVHVCRFLHEQFPKGTGFPPVAVPSAPDDLPLADISAFSIDDAHTTEVDDALSVKPLSEGGWRIGIHIAAPGLVILQGDALDAIARARLSTVYMPGAKITMLPEEFVRAYTLQEGRDCPAASIYFTLAEDFSVLAQETRVERVRIAANLRHHEVEPWFNEATVHENTVANDFPDRPFREELLTLWRFSKACEARRGKPSAAQGVNDYTFAIEGDLADPERCRVTIAARTRGGPLDTLVAEMMILANSSWGGLLAARGVPCLYRSQTGGKARMTTAPQPHEGLGVPQYAWMTSPLRRYSDLLNQWQLFAVLEGKAPPYLPRSSALFAVMRDFESVYAAYAEFQRRIERYWCLRWLRQEGVEECVLSVRRDDLARFEGLPLFTRLSGAGQFPPGQRLKARLDGVDFLRLEAHCHVLRTLDHGDMILDGEEEEAEFFSEAEAPSEAVPLSDTGGAETLC
ncbi:MAG: RNB domain-containing ribonuclease [Zoogloeaceae bacterium]|nr:RNB domain-containing ribonuclease [Zoogloeaceae bacterium]